MNAIVAIVQALAWPVTVLILVFAFRRSFSPALIEALFQRMLIFKAGPVEITFEKELQEVEQKAKIAFPQLAKEKQNTLLVSTQVDPSETLSLEVGVSPRAAMLKAWIELEKAIVEAANAVGAIEPERRSKYKVLQDLLRRGIITEEFMQVFNQLRDIRDKVVQSANTEVGSLDGERYIEVATDFAVQIRRAGRKQPHSPPSSPEAQKHTG